MAQKSLKEIRKQAKALLLGGLGSAAAKKEFEQLSAEFATLKATRRGGFGRGAGSNFDAYGEVVSKVKKGSLEDGVYMVKGGECRKMKESNGTGTVCVVYRVAAKGKVEEKPVKKPAKVDKKAVAKKADKKALAKKVATKKNGK